MFSVDILLEAYLMGLALSVPAVFVLFVWLILERPETSTKEEAEEFIVAVCRVVGGMALWPLAMLVLLWILGIHLVSAAKVVISW